MSFRASIKPIVEAYPISSEDLFNYGFRAGACSDTESIERDRFNKALNIELTKAFEAGREYEKATNKCAFNKD